MSSRGWWGEEEIAAAPHGSRVMCGHAGRAEEGERAPRSVGGGFPAVKDSRTSRDRIPPPPCLADALLARLPCPLRLRSRLSRSLSRSLSLSRSRPPAALLRPSSSPPAPGISLPA